VALVTGGGRGIGAATARELGTRGYQVVVNYHRNADAAGMVVEAITAVGGSAVAAQADVRDPEQAARLVDDAVAAFGQLDVLVCSAGMGVRPATFAEITWPDFAGRLTDEFASVFFVTKTALDAMRPRNYGRIVYLSSALADHGGTPGMIALGAAKAALNTFARYLAVEVGPDGITVNVVAPGFVRTEASAWMPKERLTHIAEHTPLHRIAEAEDISQVIAMIADEASFMTGVITPVDGGIGLG
jgi:3-oxoacyl-[acyl-carrier protein] reductase